MKSLYILVLAAIVLGSSSCGTGKSKVNQKKPESVAIGFIKHIAKLELKDAEKLCMGETKQMLGLASEMMNSTMSAEDKKRAIAEAEEDLKYIKKADCNVDGNKATCKVCCNDKEEWTPEDLVLEKVDGKWFINMPMPNKEGGGGF
ncbi:MAG: DUF4878 domain-containing protein [Aureispira sp.]|nr:DUF4878 domain-containing protein [Aureispira sp.]